MSFGIPVRNGVMLGLTASTALSTRGGFPVPALSLNFLSGTLDSRITFTRALNTATRVNSSGLMETVNANIPRFDYNPVTLQPRGLLIEETRTNVILHSEDLGNAAWRTNFGAGVTILTNQANGPDGQQKLDRVTSAGAGAGVYQTFTLAFSTAHSVSMFVRQGTATTSQIAVFNTVAGVFVSLTFTWTGGVPSTSASVGSPTNVQYENFGGGLYRISFTFTSRGSGDHWPVYVPDTTAGLGTGFTGYAQLEAGSFATSYIPTVASTVTRNADVATMTGTNFSSWYNQTEGTFVTSFSMLALNTVTTQELLALDDGSVANSIALRANNTAGDTSSTASVASVSQGFLNIAGAAANVTQKVAHGIKLNDAALVRNGGAVVTDTTYAVPPGQIRMAIGQRTSNFAQINGHIRSIVYFNTRLPNDRLQALTR